MKKKPVLKPEELVSVNENPDPERKMLTYERYPDLSVSKIPSPVRAPNQAYRRHTLGTKIYRIDRRKPRSSYGTMLVLPILVAGLFSVAPHFPTRFSQKTKRAIASHIEHDPTRLANADWMGAIRRLVGKLRRKKY